MYLFDGSNDGLVSKSSAAWGEYKGEIKSPSFLGYSHLGAVDIYKMKYNFKQSMGTVTDIPEFYIKLVSDLKKAGF